MCIRTYSICNNDNNNTDRVVPAAASAAASAAAIVDRDRVCVCVYNYKKIAIKKSLRRDAHRQYIILRTGPRGIGK